ncbi:carbonic anhydrase [Ancylobacter sp. MQZ15Z-1]|uniref:carbonic anhydrase n=1 Tax=Ancylobacter mangrovi TaxID=2972472 RepID=A0A9X2PFF7_9HYPH|nr:carbonic anhydrase [Ancylobacter mangrovi]MCS0496960.1 carbonic anhydrase [Ancylobacter mangrovi]
MSRASAQTAAPAGSQDALTRLKEGNARYVANAPINTDHSVGRSKRSLGQQPFAAIVTCSDSRVVPELIFDQGPGELFIVRVAGNFINEDGLASLEYGAAVLGIGTILVLGHSSCGAVDATIKSIKDRTLPPGHLPSLVNAIRPAVYAAMDDKAEDLLAAATAKNAQLNAERAKTAAPILSDLHSVGKLTAAAGVYDISTGQVTFM